jgi:hypothetical protein
LRPTPSPAPGSASRAAHPGPDINAKLRALLPTTGGVPPSRIHYAPGYKAIGTQLDPTPPPDVIARTKFLYETASSGNEKRTKMWVTAVRKTGPVTLCTGWLVRYPEPPTMGSIGPINGANNGTQIRIGGGRGAGVLSPGAAGQAPIIEVDVTYVCSGRRLVPFVPPATP